jgi:cyclophilin family peptidyl-prolyl cis-trans isomerase
MAKGDRTGSKQRKSKLPDDRDLRRARRAGDDEPAPVTTVNQRQIATGTLATSGERGTDAVNRISDWLQANGKFVVSLIVILIVTFLIVLTVTRSGDRTENRLQALVIQAGQKGGNTFKDLTTEYDRIYDEVKSSPQHVAEWNYRLATSIGGILVNEARNGRKLDPDEVTRLMEVIDAYKAGAAADPVSEYRTSVLEGIRTRLESYGVFRTSSHARALTDAEYKRADKPEPKIVPGADKVRVGFETTQGSFEMDFYDVEELRNSVNLVVTLVERGYYNGIQVSNWRAPGVGRLDEPLVAGTRLVGFGATGKLDQLPKEEDAEKELTAKEKREREEKRLLGPYFTIDPETSSRFRNTRGTVVQWYNLSSPNIRGAHLTINLADHPQFDGKYQVIGEVVEGMAVAEALGRNDRISAAWVISKSDRDYTPRVIFTQGPNAGSLPSLWFEKDSKPEAPTIPKTDLVIDETAKPAVVISTAHGDVMVELEEDVCPNTVANFIYLIKQDGYKGSMFHRVEGVGQGGPDARGLRIVQGGRDPAMIQRAKDLRESAKDKRDRARTTSATQAATLEAEASSDESEADGLLEKHGWVIKNEAKEDGYNLRNTTGTIAMARTGDLDSAGRQFFVNLRDFPDWDKKDSPYTVFGRVTQNLWVLHNIRKDDEIKEVWVVRARKPLDQYIPVVKKEGATSFSPITD